MKYAVVLIGAILFANLAQAEIIHDGHCSEFETQHACVNQYTNDPYYHEECSCPGSPAPTPPPFTGMRCGPANHMTGDRYCCSYVNGVSQQCWTE